MTERNRVVALGFFDGVHRGHGALMECAVKRAGELGALPTMVSFDTHPDSLVKGERVPLINSAEDREDIAGRIFGIHSVILIHFDQQMMHMPWEQFAEYLRCELSAVHIVVGRDFRFGFKGEGDPERLGRFCRGNGMGMDVIPEVLLEGVTVSSTHIRSLLAEGDVERANAFLGHPYSLTDTVAEGFHLGRTIDAPTINMGYQPGVLVPRHGVYAARAWFDGAYHDAVTNIGVRPTVGGKDAVTVESHILDFSGDLYGKQVRLEFFAFLRPERKFDSLEQLRQQIRQDELTAREILANTSR